MSELPDPPWRVLSYRHIYPNRDIEPRDPCWFAYSQERGLFYDCDEDRVESDYDVGRENTYYHPREMIVVAHPRNDPEAIAIIEAAKKGASGGN